MDSGVPELTGGRPTARRGLLSGGANGTGGLTGVPQSGIDAGTPKGAGGGFPVPTYGAIR